MIEIDKILGKLDESERAELGSFIHMLHDPLSRNILAKLASPHTPMCLNDVPLEKLDANDSVSVMSRLHKFENMNLVKSEMKKHNSGAYRTFSITDGGKEIVQKYIKKESERYN